MVEVSSMHLEVGGRGHLNKFHEFYIMIIMIIITIIMIMMIIIITRSGLGCGSCQILMEPNT